MASEEAILEFTIIVNAKASQQTDDLIKSLESAKKTKQTLQPVEEQREEALDFESEEAMQDPDFFRAKSNAIRDAIGEEVEKAVDEKIKNYDFLENLDDTQIKRFGTILKQFQNPLGFLEDALDAILPVRVTKILKILLAGGGIAFIANEMIKFLGQKGGPLNRDFRRLMSEEVDAGLSRKLAIRRELGVDQVILTQQGGRFAPNNENWTYNSFYAVNKHRIERIGLSDRAAGVYSS
jgi:hypothetical protein